MKWLFKTGPAASLKVSWLSKALLFANNFNPLTLAYYSYFIPSQYNPSQL